MTAQALAPAIGAVDGRGAGWSSNLALALVAAAGTRPRGDAIVSGTVRTSFDGLAAHAAAVTRIVREHADVGDRVAIMVPPGPAAAAAFFGVLAAGAVAVNVYEGLRERQVQHILQHSGAKMVLTTDRLSARSAGTPVPAVLVDGIEGDEALVPVPRVAGDVAHLVYTSGSTGRPKGIAVSHGNLWAGAASVTGYLGIQGDDRIGGLLPFSFDYGLNQLLCAVHTASTLVVERSPIAARVVDTLHRERVSVVPAVPPLWLQLLDVTAFRSPVPSVRLMTNTGGRLPAEAVRALRRYQPQAHLFLMYGLTEAFRSTFLSPALVDAKPGSIGRAIPGAEVMVLDEGGTPCAPNEIGEIVHRGPTVALGYWDDEEATVARFKVNPYRATAVPASERVVYSGDLGYRDEDGDLYFVGRRDSLIKTQGYRVSPDEVAEVLYASGEVLEAVIGAEPDDERGSTIVAYVVLVPGGDAGRLAAFCRRELPSYMQPYRYDVRTSLPRTSTGKFDTRAAAARESPP